MSSFLIFEGYSNADEITWRHHTCPRFSFSMVIRMPMRVPEDIIHVLVSLCRRLFECRWEYLKTSYMFSLHFIEGYSNEDENTWRHHTCSRFSFSKVIWMPIRIPEDIIHVLVSLFWRLFECRWQYLKTSYMSSFLFVEGYSNTDKNTWSYSNASSFLVVEGDSLYQWTFEYRWEYIKAT